MSNLLIIPALYLLSGLSAGLRRLYTVPFIGAFFIALWMLNSPPEQSFAVSWFQSGEFTFSISLSMDTRTTAVIAFATLVAAVVAIYSLWYFRGDPGETRFRLTLSLFMTAMYGLLAASNLLLTFFCWELVGLSSYLLIGYYRVNTDAGPAATKALMMNKIGDAGFIVALMAIGSQTVNLQAADLSLAAAGFSEGAALIAGVGLLLAVMAKSAQVPLHTWLPDAMAGPAPVSALIHSATMVASGVYLLVRWDFLFPEVVRTIAGTVGLVTMLIAGWNALSQTGLKKLLAWSTISQLGLMVMAAGYGNGNGALVHLVTHGFFKAGLFLLAGIVLLQQDHATHAAETHELETLGKHNSISRWLSICLLVLSAGSAGLPLTGSFVSKEAIVATLPAPALAAFFIGSLLTIAYTGRLLWYLKPFSGSGASHPWRAMAPVGAFTLLSLWFTISRSPFPTTTWNGLELPQAEGRTIAVTIWVVALVVLGWSFRNREAFSRLERIAPALYLDTVYDRIIVIPILGLSRQCERLDRLVIDRIVHGITYSTVIIARITEWLDRTVVDGTITLIAGSIRGCGSLLRKLAAGDIRGYLWWAAAGLVVLLTCLT